MDYKSSIVPKNKVSIAESSDPVSPNKLSKRARTIMLNSQKKLEKTDKMVLESQQSIMSN